MIEKLLSLIRDLENISTCCGLKQNAKGGRMTKQKSIIQIMYETILENGGPTGPISKAIVDTVEGRSTQKEISEDKKVIIQFKKFNR